VLPCTPSTNRGSKVRSADEIAREHSACEHDVGVNAIERSPEELDGNRHIRESVALAILNRKAHDADLGRALHFRSNARGIAGEPAFKVRVYWELGAPASVRRFVSVSSALR